MSHSTGKSYKVGAVVHYSGYDYRARKEVPVGVSITSRTYWERLPHHTQSARSEDNDVSDIVETAIGVGISLLDAVGDTADSFIGGGGDCGGGGAFGED